MALRTTSATLTSGNSYLKLFNNSSGTDTVIFGIFLPPRIYVNTSKYVEIFKAFGFERSEMSEIQSLKNRKAIFEKPETQSVSQLISEHAQEPS